MKAFHKTFAIFFLISASSLVHGAQPRSPCESALTSRIARILERPLRSMPLDPVFGMPSSQAAAEIVSQKRLDVIHVKLIVQGFRPADLAALNRPADEFILASDFGPSFWRMEELVAWYDLSDSPALIDPQRAAGEVLEIVESDTYCTPGLAPDLCEVLRRSYQAHRRRSEGLVRRSRHEPARSRLPPPPPSANALRQAFSPSPHDVQIEFPWEESRTNGLVHMPPRLALRVLEVLAAETLLRRTAFYDLEGRLQMVGDQVDLASRLLVAAHPRLMPLLPLWAGHPAALPPGPLFATSDQSFTWIRHPLAVGPFTAHLIVDLHSLPGFEEDRLPMGFALDSHLFKGSREEQRRFEGPVRRWILEARRDFSHYLGRGDWSFTLEWDDFVTSDLAVDFEGLTPAEQLLFAMFLLERPLPTAP